MAAAPFIRGLAAMIAPHRIAEIERARIRGRADYGTRRSADRGARGRIARHRSDCGTRARAQQTARHRAIARIGAASRKHQSGRESRSQRNGSERHYCLHSCAAFR